MHIERFLSSLTSSNEDGRIAVTAKRNESSSTHLKDPACIKFLLLNPATHFKDIVEVRLINSNEWHSFSHDFMMLKDCRAVIVAGGTMQPSCSFVNQLLTPLGVPKERIFEFSCGHVIGKDQLLPVVLAKGPSSTDFEFTFGKRKNVKLVYHYKIIPDMTIVE